MYGLITAGFAKRSRRSEGYRPSPAIDARVHEHRNLGVAFFKTGMMEEAEREFRQVVELNPRLTIGHYYLGLTQVHQRQWDEAEVSFERVMDLGDRRPPVLFNMAYCLQKQGRLDDAEKLYADAAAGARQDHRILTGWGVLAIHQKRYEVAEGRLDRAREVADGAPSALWYWARSLLAAAVNQFPEARAFLEQGLERHPGHPVLRNNLAVLLEMIGELEQAEQVLRESYLEGDEIPQMAKNLGDVWYRQGRYDEAREAYERAAELAPGLGDDLYFKLGNIAYRLNELERASTMWHKALELNPEHQLARTNLDTMSALAG